MQVIYGTTDTKEGTHIDTSKTLLGAKQYATRNGLKTVSKRIGYNAHVVCEKINNKWVMSIKKYRVYLFGDIVFESDDILCCEAFRNTYKEPLYKNTFIEQNTLKNL